MQNNLFPKDHLKHTFSACMYVHIILRLFSGLAKCSGNYTLRKSQQILIIKYCSFFFQCLYIYYIYLCHVYEYINKYFKRLQICFVSIAFFTNNSLHPFLPPSFPTSCNHQSVPCIYQLF